MAILLYESSFLSKSILYGTDFNNEALDSAKKGIYNVESMKQYIENYNRTEGKKGFSHYYISKYNSVKMHDFLKENMTFANHNLVTDRSFGEMNVILCRNVLIYFDNNLQNRVLELFRQSLCHHGYLCLGTKETLKFTSVEKYFEVIDSNMKIYRKIS